MSDFGYTISPLPAQNDTLLASANAGKTSRTAALPSAPASAAPAAGGAAVDNRYTELDVDLSGNGATPIGALQPQACEGDATSVECYLTEQQRHGTVAELGDRAGILATRWHAAISEGRMEALAEDENSWGFVLEILFLVTSVGAGNAIVRGLTWLSQANLSTRALNAIDSLLANPKRLTDNITLLSKGTRTWAKNKCHKGPKRKKIDVIDDLADLPGQWATEMRNAAPVELNDVELVALCTALDPVNYPMSWFREKVNTLVARYSAQVQPVGEQSQRVATISGTDGDGKCQLRPALVKCLGVGGSGPTSIQRGDMFCGGDDTRTIYLFVRWIDDDMLGAAEERDRAAYGQGSLFLSADESEGESRLANADHAEVQKWLKQLATQKESAA